MLTIEKLKLHSRLIAAPMAGITDLPFRRLLRQFGAQLAFVEMINVRSLGFSSNKTVQMLTSDNDDKPLGVQILGCEPQYILRAMEILKSYRFEVLDFNAACPVKKVTRRGEGASLLKDPARLHELLALVVKHSWVPVTVKIRTGWDTTTVNAPLVARAAQDAGVAAIFIHGRTKLQGYSGKVDYDSIRKVKKTADVPVIASGDVMTPVLAKYMLDETGCDGLLIARGALGNPWIFRRIEAFLKNGELVPPPQASEVADCMIRHLELCTDFHGERNGVKLFHKFFGWYAHGFRHIRVLRQKAFGTKTIAGMRAVIESLRGLRCQHPR